MLGERKWHSSGHSGGWLRGGLQEGLLAAAKGHSPWKGSPRGQGFRNQYSV